MRDQRPHYNEDAMAQTPITFLNDDSSPQASPGRKDGGGCFKGCMIWVVAGVLVLVVAAGLVLLNLRSIGSRIAAYVVKRAVEQSDLPADQKRGLIARVDRLREDFVEGRITDEQLKRIGDEVLEGPLLPVGMVMFLDQEHVAKSGLSEVEKSAAKLTLRRLSRGFIEKTIRPASLDAVFATISGPDEQGKRQIKKHLTDTEIRDFLTLAEREVEKAKVPVEPLEIDLAKELDAAIERGMKEPLETPF